MELGFIGLGRMGAGMVERMAKRGVRVVAYNRSPEKTKRIARKGAIPAYGIDEMIGKLPKRRIVWTMLPAGQATDDMINEVLKHLKRGDILIDGANDFYENAERHDRICREKGVIFFDCGVSGGVWGLKNGYTLMIGGDKSHFKDIEPACRALAPKGGYAYFGPAGSGHFVKSVHNIVEYVYLQGLAEGVGLLSSFKHPIDLRKATSVWQPASVIRSWLLDLTTSALGKPDFSDIEPKIGSVTIEELERTKNAVGGYAPAFDVATAIRKDTSGNFVLGKRLIAAVRNEFGGHAVERSSSTASKRRNER